MDSIEFNDLFYHFFKTKYKIGRIKKEPNVGSDIKKKQPRRLSLPAKPLVCLFFSFLKGHPPHFFLTKKHSERHVVDIL
jgi:hypothetical protein